MDTAHSAVPEIPANTGPIHHDRDMSASAEEPAHEKPSLDKPTTEIPADSTPEPETPTTPQTTPGKSGRGTVPHTRTGYTWIALVVAALLGIVLLIFILQNLAKVAVKLLFWQVDLPLGIMLLLSVIGGALVMALVGGVRMLQLRRSVARGGRPPTTAD